MRFCTCYNLYKNVVQAITCTTQKYKLNIYIYVQNFPISDNMN